MILYQILKIKYMHPIIFNCLSHNFDLIKKHEKFINNNESIIIKDNKKNINNSFLEQYIKLQWFMYD